MKFSEAKKILSPCVYKLTFPDGKMYVGKTKCLKDRVHLYSNKEHSTCKVDAAISKFGIDNVDVEIVCKVDGIKKSDLELVLSVLEIKYIRDIDTIYPKGYNVSSGGGYWVFP